ncbi:MAG TPA: hypothetical protein VIU45_05990 [Chitinophagaceae bacterium]
MRSFYRALFWVTLFSIAMGYLETSVVVYLREIYYPAGFRFPLTVMPPKAVLIELLREAGTVIMLMGIGVLAGHSKPQRFAWFIYSFAIWDIFYYIFLKLLIGWPANLLTWDILFLIPVPWVGPVLAPCIVSLTMILTALMILRYEAAGVAAKMNGRERSLLVIGSVTVIFSFCADFLRHASSLTQGGVKNYVPQHFDWWVFILGEAVLSGGIILLGARLKQQRNKK